MREEQLRLKNKQTRQEKNSSSLSDRVEQSNVSVVRTSSLQHLLLYMTRKTADTNKTVSSASSVNAESSTRHSHSI